MNEQLVDILLTQTTVLAVYPLCYGCLCLLCLVCTGAAVPLDLIRCSRMQWSEDLQVLYLPSRSNSTISSVALWEVNRNNNTPKKEGKWFLCGKPITRRPTRHWILLLFGWLLLCEYIQYTMHTITIVYNTRTRMSFLSVVCF